MMTNVEQLEEIANQLRIDVIDSIYTAQSGHPGGSLSAADIVTALYFYKMRLDPQNPAWEERDRFILSKGHAAPLLYAALARKGFFNIAELKGLRRVDSMLQGAPSTKTPGIDMSAGPLGQGLSVAVGMALAGKYQKRNYKTYVILGDGELQEGQVWEAFMAAAAFKLGNLVAILDYNKVQMNGTVDEILPIGDPVKKFEGFGWKVIRINGHDMMQIMGGLDAIDDNPVGAPTAIVADTIKGKGVSYMEGLAEWHGLSPNQEQYEQALKELGRGIGDDCK
jgi:transketolase